MKKFDSINVIPFIDIMLVLLAIVLTTATFISKGQLDINLPRASTDAASVDSEPVEIAIDRNEQFYFQSAPVSQTELTEKLNALPVETPVLLSIDETVQFRQFVTVIDVLKSLSLDKVSIVTREGN